MDGKSFCPDPLWDMNLTWYTDNPDLTACFEKTVLIYFPTLALLLLTPVQFSLIKASRDKNVPWSLLNILRLGLTAALAALAIADLVYAIMAFTSPTYNSYGYSVFIVADVVKLATFLLALALQYLNMKNGIVTSGIMLFFWTLEAIAGVLPFRTTIMSEYNDGEGIFIIATIEYPFILAILFLSCWADPKPKDIAFEDQLDDLTPEKYASAFSRLIFGWLDPLIIKGWKKQLDKTDLWSLLLQNRSCTVVPRWDFYWKKEEVKKKSKGRHLSILPVILNSFGPPYLLAAFLTLLLSILQFASPQIVNLLIDFVQSDDPQWKGYFYTILIVAVTFVVTILNAQAFYREYQIGLRIRTALISSIYRKSLRLSNTSRKEMTVGETTNLMQIDTQKFMDLALYLNLIWSSPLQIILAMYFLWNALGPSAMAGLAVMILMGPINAIVARKMKKYQLIQMKNKDQRTKTMDEILNGMKILKLYAWETSFRDKVNGIRSNEIGALKKAAYLNAIMTFLWVCAPVVVALASFATFVLIDENNILDANTAFVSLTLFNLLRFPLNVLPILLVYLIQCQVSLKRINKYMNAEELDPNAVTHDETKKSAIVVDNGTFSWDKGSKPTLTGINLSVKEGELIAVVGQVGVGKSSLLSALLGEMDKVSGHVNTKGKVAYVPQQAWIQNATVQYNIVFGKKFDEKKYNKVLDGCALLPDLKILPGGDQTEIGEKGINLSGGQKQRISMARSVYNDANLYYLDDPLSAVDAHVGSHIFEKVIGPNGLLKGKTRILVTHGVKFLPKVDKIIVMKDGQISEQGTYHELLKAGGQFAEFLVEYLAEEVESDVEDLEDLKQTLENVLGRERFEKQMSHARSVRSQQSSGRRSQRSETRRHTSQVQSRLSRKESVMTTTAQSSEISKPAPPPIQAGQNLIEDEKMQVGGVKWYVYMYYINSIGGWMVIGTILLYLGFTGCSVGSSIWLSRWSTDPKASTDIGTRNLYLSIYGVLGLLQSLFIMLGTVVLSIGTLNAASKMHGTMLERILRSPMSFFDTTPLGRILNRFSKDIDIVDVTLPMILRGLVNNLLAVLGTIIIICYSNPLFVAVIIPVGLFFYVLQKFYIATARQIKRLESISRSPIYSHFGETLSGAVTIRAYSMAENFIKENERKIDINQVCYYPTFVCSRWLSVRLENLGNLVVFFASLFAVLTRDWMDPGLVGLALSNALTVTNAMSYLVSMASEIETNMVGVERIKEYQEIKEEAPLYMPEQDPPAEWPEYGMVKFDNYQTRYREGLDLVLKGIDCNIRAGEKVGIVGRTGAGKSSLTLALFRIIESSGGSISIDGQNIGLMGLYRLRSRLTIIPQDPVLFSGTLRMNLDPFNEKSDDAIWRALDQSHLKSYVSNLASGLDFEVNEGGENLSVGQRQLVCLGRALLRKTKVLVLDEATAAVDLETDDLIQATIRKEFVDCTVLTIAHRLNTIMDSSKVMVLDNGKIVEYDSPSELLRNPRSVFYGMAKEAGLLSSQPQPQGHASKHTFQSTGAISKQTSVSPGNLIDLLHDADDHHHKKDN